MKVEDFQEDDIVMVSKRSSKNFGKFAIVSIFVDHGGHVRLYPIRYSCVASKMKKDYGFEGESITRALDMNPWNVTLIFRNNHNARKPKI